MLYGLWTTVDVKWFIYVVQKLYKTNKKTTTMFQILDVWLNQETEKFENQERQKSGKKMSIGELLIAPLEIS